MGTINPADNFSSQLHDAEILENDDLTDEFRADWRRQIERFRDADRTSYLGQLIEADPDDLEIVDDEHGVTVRNNGRIVGEWPSTAAIDADVAAFVTLQEWLPTWGELTGQQRDELIARLRAFLEECPNCDGPLDAESRSEADIPRVVCGECGTVIL